jgi:hypothetical protein
MSIERELLIVREKKGITEEVQEWVIYRIDSGNLKPLEGNP